MKEIPLTQGKVALVDDEDYDYLMQWKWYAGKFGTKFYAQRESSKNKTAQMHVEIAKRVGLDGRADHIDREPLNNQRFNLRPASQAQNSYNCGLRKDNTSGYKGVHWYKRYKKWRARIGVNHKRRCLGYFESKEEAARAYDTAALKYFGEFAVTNLTNPEYKVE